MIDFLIMATLFIAALLLFPFIVVALLVYAMLRATTIIRGTRPK